MINFNDKETYPGLAPVPGSVPVEVQLRLCVSKGAVVPPGTGAVGRQVTAHAGLVPAHKQPINQCKCVPWDRSRRQTGHGTCL